MRLGVLDIGSNTIHLLVVEAYNGAPPVPKKSLKTTLKLASLIDDDNVIPKQAFSKLSSIIEKYVKEARNLDCKEIMPFATSAIREAKNGDEVLESISRKTGCTIQTLSGEEEAQVTYLAVRRWFGWAAGRILSLDIGGGSVEISVGNNETPEYCASLPIGTGRVLRKFELSTTNKENPDILPKIQKWLKEQISPVAKKVNKLGPFDMVVGTSKTFRLLSEISGYQPAQEKAFQQISSRSLIRTGYFLSHMKFSGIASIDGVSSNRAELVVPGAQIITALLQEFNVTQLHLCPWALREGLILQKTATIQKE